LPRLRSARFAAILLVWLIAPAAATSPSEKSIFDFVDRLMAASRALSATVWQSEERARDECREMLGWAFDVPGMAEYALGDAWNRITPSQRMLFRASFEDLVVHSFVRQIRADPDRSFAFVGYRSESSERVLAATRALVPERPEQIWLWRLQWMPEGAWRVVDLIVDGRSVLLAERQEYARVLEANEGRIDAVVAFIRRRIGR
jgi:phospholipid transport system substrate-binding protein